MDLELKVNRKSWVSGVTIVVEAQVSGKSIKIREGLERENGRAFTSGEEAYFLAKGLDPGVLEYVDIEVSLWEPEEEWEKYARVVYDFPSLNAADPHELKFAQVLVELGKLGHLDAYKNSRTNVSCAKKFEHLLLNKITPVDDAGFGLTPEFDDERDRELFKTFDSSAHEIVAHDLSAQMDRSIWVNEAPWLTYRCFNLDSAYFEAREYIALPPPGDGPYKRVPFAHWEREGDLLGFGSGTSQASLLFEVGESLYAMDLISSPGGANHAVVTRLEVGTEAQIVANWLHTLEPRWTLVYTEFLKLERGEYMSSFTQEEIVEVVADLKMNVVNGFHSATRNFERRTVFDNISLSEIREKFWLHSSRWVVLRPCVMWGLEMLEENTSILSRAESKIQKVDLHDGSVRYGIVAREETDVSTWRVIPDLSTEVSRNYWGDAIQDEPLDEIWLYETMQHWPGLSYQFSGNLSDKELLAVVRSMTFGEWDENEFRLMENDECAHCVSDLNNSAVNFNRPTDLN